MSKLLLLLTLVSSSSALALDPGTMTVTGKSFLSAEPDYISVNAVILSTCYKDPKLAQQKNVEIATEVKNIFSKYVDKDNKKSGVFVKPGFTKLQEEFSNNGRREALCYGFRVSTNITLKTDQIEQWANLQSEFYTSLQSALSNQAPAAQTTTVSLSEPQTNLYKENRAELEQLAYEEARAKAVSQMEATSADCGIAVVGFLGFSQQQSYNQPYSAARSLSPAAGGLESADGPAGMDLALDVIWVNQAVSATYAISPTHMPTCNVESLKKQSVELR